MTMKLPEGISVTGIGLLSVNICEMQHLSPTELRIQLQQPGVISAIDEQVRFYPRDAMLARVIEIVTCLSVCPSVRHAPVLCQNEES